MTQAPVSENSFGAIRAAVYHRTCVSDPGQVTTAGLIEHTYQSIAESKGWTLTGIYTDEGNGNAARKELLAACQNQEVDIIIIRNLSVLDRDLQKALAKVAEFLMLKKPVGFYIETEDISDRFALSNDYISSLIKKETGSAFKEYLTMLRIGEGKRLLREEKELTIAEVAERVGYRKTSNFSKKFKEITGMLPSEYR